jgi:hypothetical protein
MSFLFVYLSPCYVSFEEFGKPVRKKIMSYRIELDVRKDSPTAQIFEKAAKTRTVEISVGHRSYIADLLAQSTEVREIEALNGSVRTFSLLMPFLNMMESRRIARLTGAHESAPADSSRIYAGNTLIESIVRGVYQKV